MITEADLAQWRPIAPWPTDEQIEQDLVLSRLIIEIANHPLLGDELVFRGGTCFHKLWLDRPWRYSEDLDYVRTTAGGVGPVLDALREVGEIVGFDVAKTNVGRHPKIHLDSTFLSGSRMRVKVEINTFERSPAVPIVTRPLSVENAWFTGSADVPTFTLEELVATKIRALYQRRKGRDLFDLWLAIEQGGATPEGIAACFGPYWPDGWTTTLARENLEAKVEDRRFTTDLERLVTDWPGGYSIDAGAQAASAVLDEIALAEHSN